jgi:peptidoglycan hydrolase-like protein with peptidoglycan-binding domain
MSMRLTISRRLFLLAAICLCSISTMGADQLIASAQQILKDQGFYYGNVDGEKNSETTAAIRRYQIRNGLKINGELNTETQRSLGVGTEQPSTSVKKETQPSSRDEPISPDNSALPDTISPSRTLPGRGYVPGPQAGTSRALDGTPYEAAPPDLQQEVIANAQIMLARRGYYRSDIDGVYGPGTQFALRAYQARVGLTVTGRLDLETLAAMGMLPEMHRLEPPHWRFPRQRPEPVYKGEWGPEQRLLF